MADLPLEATRSVVDRATAEDYAAWAGRREASGADPYYSEKAVRFVPVDEDVLVVVGDVAVGPGACGVVVSSERARARFEVCGVDVREASAALAAVDGNRTLAEARAAAAVGDEAWNGFLARAFGTVLLAPRAVVELEDRVSGVEIVRYPGSPYEIVRPYWSNMGDVAARLSGSDELGATPAFIQLLRELNVLALIGASRKSFYLPASPVAGKRRLEPGELWTVAAVVEPSASGSGADRFVAGPRVNASPIGGALYHELLRTALEVPGVESSAQEFADASGRDWGRIVVARADHDDAAAPWFCPPRPIDAGHFDALRNAFGDAMAAAERKDTEASLRSLALFHQRFVRLHPFRAANQCVAMSLVNHVLRRSHGAGIPHLVLDHLALRLSEEAYARAFAVAIEGWLVVGKNPVERYLELIARKDRCFAFLNELGKVTDVASAKALATQQAADAKLAFVSYRVAP